MVELSELIWDALDGEFKTARMRAQEIGYTSKVVAQAIRFKLNNVVETRRDPSTGLKRYRRRCRPNRKEP